MPAEKVIVFCSHTPTTADKKSLQLSNPQSGKLASGNRLIFGMFDEKTGFRIATY